MRQKATPNKKSVFLEAYAVCGLIRRAAQAAQIHHSTHYRWLHEDPDYAGAFALAEEMAISGMEDEARFRATEGLKKYKFDKGQPVYIRCKAEHPDAVQIGALDDGAKCYGWHYFEYDRSDTLLLALLNAAHPERFGRYRHEHSGKVEHEHGGKVIVHLPDNGRGLHPLPPQRRVMPSANGSGNGNDSL